MEGDELWSLGPAWERRAGTLSVRRRDFLRLLAAGASTATVAGMLAACTSRVPTTPGGGAATTSVAPTSTLTGGTAGASPTAAGPGVSRPVGPNATNTAGGGVLTQAATSDARSFHPYQVTDTVSLGYIGYIYGGGELTDYDPNTLELVPKAAERFTLSDDKKTVTFALKDIKWSDGTPLTAADYVWTWEQAKKPENEYPYAQNLEQIVSYRAQGPKTLVVTLKEALVVGVESASSIVPLPKHIWEKLDWSDPAKNPQISNPTVGCGSWKLQEWKRDVSATFVANDLAPEGRPSIDRMVVRIFGGQTLAYQALKAGEVDWASFQPSDYAEAKRLPNITVYDWYPAEASWQYVGFNLRRPALQDPLVRRAIAYATDRQGIIDSAAGGLAKPTYSNYVPDSWVYNPNVERYDFNPSKAAELFRQAGYTLDRGRKLIKDGRPLALTLLFGPATNKVRESIATILQQQLQELGVTVEVQGLEFQAYLDEIQQEPYDYDLYVLGWVSTIDPHWSYQIWSEAGIPSLNSGAYVNKEVERLYEQGAREFDRERRKAIYGQIQQILGEDAPYVFLYVPLSYTGINKRVGGVTVTKRGIEPDLHRWRIAR